MEQPITIKNSQEQPRTMENQPNEVPPGALLTTPFGFLLRLNTQQAAGTGTIIFVIDKSGSMAGSSINHVKQGLQYLVPILLATERKVVFVLYDNHAQTIPITAHNWRASIANIRADGSTSFSNADLNIQRLLQSETDFVNIVYMTDGQDSNSAQYVHTPFKSNAGHRVDVIGVGRDHDARTLLSIKTLDGTFQYAGNEAANMIPIGEAVRVLEGILYGGSGAVTAEIMTDPAITVKLTLRDGIGLINYQAGISANVPKGTKVVLTIGTGSAANVIISEVASGTPVDTVESGVQLIGNILVGVATIMKNGGDPHACIHRMETLLAEARGAIAKLRPRQRQVFIPKLNDLGDSIRDIKAVIAQNVRGQITNETLAKLTHAAYRTGLKKRDLAKLDDLAEKNAAIFYRDEEQIEELSQNVNNENSPLNELYECFLTLQGVTDALIDGSALGIAISIGRSPAAIHQPATIRVFSVGPSIISVRAFLDAASGLVNGAKINDSGPVKAGAGNVPGNVVPNNNNVPIHGGFDRAEGQVMVGEARETINAVLPLFISPTHWQISRLLLKQVLGWICTTDPLGYSYSQVVTVPFVILAKTMRDCVEAKNSEHSIRIYKLVFDVCGQIMTSDKTLFADTLAIYSNFATKFTKDCVPSLDCFLAQLHVAKVTQPDIFKEVIPDPDFAMRVFVEEVRRSCFKEVVSINEVVKSIIGFTDLEKTYCEPAIEKFAIENTGKNEFSLQTYAQSFVMELDPSEAAQVVSVVEKKDVDIYVPNITDASEMQIICALDTGYVCKDDGIQQTLNRVKPLMKFIGYELPSDVNDNLFRSAMVIQCLNARTNELCRDMLAQGKYFGALGNEQCINIIRTTIEQQIKTRISAGRNNLLANLRSGTSTQLAELWATSDNISVAAGILLIGDGARAVLLGENFMYYVKRLQRGGNIPLAREKLIMLTTGMCKNVWVIKDIAKCYDSRWYPSVINLRRLMRGVGIPEDEEAVYFPRNPLRGIINYNAKQKKKK